MTEKQAEEMLELLRNIKSNIVTISVATYIIMLAIGFWMGAKF